MGSKSNVSSTSNTDTPGSSLGGGAKLGRVPKQQSGNATDSKVGSGTPTKRESGAPGGMDM